MADARSVVHPAGTGPLRPRVVLGHARRMLATRWGRIGGAAFVFFVPPAACFFGAEALRDAQADAGGTSRWVLLGAVVAVASVARFLGEIFFAGFLDLAIGDDYFRGQRRDLRGVVRALPWVPLLVVDVVVNVAAAAGTALFIVPGIFVYTMFGLVGPVVVQEHRGPGDALRRTYRITRPHWFMTLTLVVIPLAIEHAAAELVRLAVRNDGILVVVGAEWLIAVSMLAVVGVVEVALATELMARAPDTRPAARRVERGPRPRGRGVP